MTALIASFVAVGFVVFPDPALASISGSSGYELDLIRWLGLAAACLVMVEAAGRRWARPVSPPSVVLRLLLPLAAVMYVLSGRGLYLILLFAVLAGTTLFRALTTVDHLIGGTFRPRD